MELTDFWDLHRERILQAFAFALFAISAFVALSKGGGSTDPYEVGTVLGTVTRNIVIGVIGAAIVNYLVDRFYWYSEEADWRKVTPEFLVAGGVVAVMLALLVGGPGTASASPQVAGDCSESQRNPQAILSSAGYTELPADQAAQVNPGLSVAAPEVAGLTHTYFNDSEADPVLITIIGAADGVTEEAVFRGFADASKQAGATVQGFSLAGQSVEEARDPRTGDRSLIAVTPCYTISVKANGDAAQTEMSRMLGAAPNP